MLLENIGYMSSLSHCKSIEEFELAFSEDEPGSFAREIFVGFLAELFVLCIDLPSPESKGQPVPASVVSGRDSMATVATRPAWGTRKFKDDILHQN